MSVYLKDSLEAYAVGPCRLDTWRTHGATVSTAAAADRSRRSDSYKLHVLAVAFTSNYDKDASFSQQP